MRLTVHRIVDFLLRILPGSRDNPSSIEARTRRVLKATQPIIEKAVAEERRVLASAVKDTAEAIDNAWYLSQREARRAKDLEALQTRLKA